MDMAGREAPESADGLAVGARTTCEALRELVAVTQADVACRAGVSRVALSGWERGGFAAVSRARQERVLSGLRSAAAAVGRGDWIPTWLTWADLGDDWGAVLRRRGEAPDQGRQIAG